MKSRRLQLLKMLYGRKESPRHYRYSVPFIVTSIAFDLLMIFGTGAGLGVAIVDRSYLWILLLNPLLYLELRWLEYTVTRIRQSVKAADEPRH